MGSRSKRLDSIRLSPMVGAYVNYNSFLKIGLDLKINYF